MPKLKSKKAAKKRFRLTKKGKVKHFHSFHSHLAGSKNAKRKRRLRKADYLEGEDAKRIKRLIEV
ncbi:MAG: 50S ribosomal protein L35 [Candidatus Hydrothermales bacterium]